MSQRTRILGRTRWQAALICCGLTLICTGFLRGAEETIESASPFLATISPFLKENCLSCHSGDEPEGGLSFAKYNESSHIQRDFEVWLRIRGALSDGVMPPADEQQPTSEDRQRAIAAITAEMGTIDCSQFTPGAVTLRRLNRVEYNNTIRDLLGVDLQPANDFPSDDVGDGFDNIGDVLTIPPLLLEKYLAAAEQVVTAALAADATRARLAPHAIAGENGIDAMRKNLIAFARRAFRRPAESVEIDRLMGLIKFVGDNGGSREQAFAAAAQAILASPHFLFLVEADSESDRGVTRRLNDFELASRLSYFLWSSMPDEQLLGLAERGQLREPSVLEAQVLRLLASEKARALVDNFAGQWLQLRDLRHLEPDPSRFPNFDDELREAMLLETQTFVSAVIREDRSVLDVLGADFTFVNNRLASFYGLPAIEGDGFRRVSTGPRRRGVLTHGSILLLTSNPTRTSPVKRGKWILDNILGEPPPPPPEGVEELEEDGEVLGTMRERLEQHRSNESCAVCHRRMDPIGFGLENFDAIGAWRERDGRFAIDASGTLLGGREFAGPAELMEILIEEKREEFCRCLAQKLLTYALGRGLSLHDRCAVDDILQNLEENEYRFSELATAIVRSEPFLLRQRTGDE